jgi:CheY-like chemotaxis protein
LRNSRGFSQETLAELANLHRTYISDVERGARNLSLESITRLAQALDVSVAALFPADGTNGKDKPGWGRNLVEILLVEDNPDDVEMTLQAFKQARFANHVAVVTDGQQALDYLFCRGKFARRKPSGRVQVVLLDLNLPKVSGWEVLRQIKADMRTARTPVVILTVTNDHYSVTECRRLGAENYIVKPVNFQRLMKVTPQLKLDWALVKPVLQAAK